MNYLNKMRREDHVNNLEWAAFHRRYAVSMIRIGAMDTAISFIDQAKRAISSARRDRQYAVECGWKMP